MTSQEGRHALIVDDDPVSIEVLKSLLAREGVTTTVIDGYTNLTTLLETSPVPDVIFLDLEMPGNSGYQVFETLKSFPQTQHVPMVAYTTHISHANQVKQSGFDGFLGKPLNRHEFPTILGQILNGEPVWIIP